MEYVRGREYQRADRMRRCYECEGLARESCMSFVTFTLLTTLQHTSKALFSGYVRTPKRAIEVRYSFLKL